MIDSIGARLRQARELRHLTLQNVSETTKVRPHYLHALETDDYSAIPSAAQARGFLRIYADFLQINLADLVPVPPAEPAPVTESAPLAPAILSSPDADSKSQRPNLWTNLRERLGRRTNKDTVASVVPQPDFPEPVPASTEATTKTSRRSNVDPAAAVTDASISDTAKVKKNVGS